MSRRPSHESCLRLSSSNLSPSIRPLLFLWATAILMLSGCGLEIPEARQVEAERFDLSDVAPAVPRQRPMGVPITEFAVEYVTDLGISEGQPGHDSEVRVVLPRRMPSDKVPALIVNGPGAYLFSGMALSDEDIEPMLPYVQQGFAVVAYETDGCQPDFRREPTPADIAQMTRRYVASKAGLINATRALTFALDQFPEIDADRLYTIGHSSGGKQALLLAAHDDRIRGCVAFAPACQMDFGTAMTVARIGGPDGDELSREVKRSMPLAHAKATQIPMLLVYSSNDRVTRPAEVLAYAKAVGDSATVVSVDCDGHGSVPDAGFDSAIEWLKGQRSTAAAEPLPTTLVSQPNGSSALPDPSRQSSPIQPPISVQPPISAEPRINSPANRSTPNVTPDPAASGNRTQPSRGIRQNPFFNQ